MSEETARGAQFFLTCSALISSLLFRFSVLVIVLEPPGGVYELFRMIGCCHIWLAMCAFSTCFPLILHGPSTTFKLVWLGLQIFLYSKHK